ncbi:hypothetical protein HYS96_02435 [Candidatus Daviesbacteria bacterium]|nr:hypothetical protein [Candidatus Daviesbacteria bacterium]
MMHILKKFDTKVIFVLFFISLFLVLIWLPNNKIIAGGDIGIPTYAPQKQLEEVTSSWWESHATGISSPVTYTAVPFYLTLSILEKLGMDSGMTQKIIFFTILFGSSLSIYYLGLNFSFNKWTSLIACLFYIFNLTSLSVWQRGVHNAMLMLLLVPLSLLILVWGIKNKKYVSILIINVVSFLLAYVFGALGFLFSLWLLWTVYIAVILFDSWSDKLARRFLLTYFFLLIISWIGSNLWWITNLLQSSNYTLGQFTQGELMSRGSDVLAALKPYHEPSIILRGLSRFYLYVVRDWGEIYSHPLFIMLSWVPTLIIFYTALIRTNYKLTPWRFLIVLTVLVLALSKGVNPPLGELNRIPFDLFQFLAPLRNTYEKVGILLTIPFSLLFALGINQIISIFKAKKMDYLHLPLLVVIVMCLIVLVWPLWLGKLFVSEGRKYAVSIPSYYSQANSWIKSKIEADDTRILHLPLSWGESIDYNWNYTGVEPSQYFFNGSSIGYQIGVPPVDSRIRDILLLIHKQDTLNIQKALVSLNIGWVVVHNETLFRDRILENPERIDAWLATKPPFIEYKTDFGPLSIWRVKDEYRARHFYSSGKLVRRGIPNPTSSLNVWNEINNLNDSFLTEIQKEQSLDKFIFKNTIIPTSKIKYSPLGLIDKETAINDIAKVGFLPDSPLFVLTLFKESLFSFLNQNDRVINCFDLSGKRLKEVVLLKRGRRLEEADKAIKRYENQFKECISVGKDTLSIYLNTPQARDLILSQLIRQKNILENEFDEQSLKEAVNQVKDILNEYLAKLGLAPKYNPVKQNLGKQLIVFDYLINKKGDYSVELKEVDEQLIKNPPQIIQIDNKAVDFSAAEVGVNIIRYPQIRLDEGFHEIQLETGEEKNILTDLYDNKKLHPDPGFTYQKDPESGEGYFRGAPSNAIVSLIFDIPNVSIEDIYEVSFDIYHVGGTAPMFIMTHDTDPTDSHGLIKPAVSRNIDFSTYPSGWRNVKLSYTPVLNATSARMIFMLSPQTGLNNPTEVLLKNISIRKVFPYQLVLEEDNPSVMPLGTAEIKSVKLNPTEYEINLTNQKLPYILIFSETFHPLWQITDSSGNKIDLPHFSINGFANGWFVDKELADRIKVKFMLQNALTQGIIIAVIFFIFSSIFLIYLDQRGKIK